MLDSCLSMKMNGASFLINWLATVAMGEYYLLLEKDRAEYQFYFYFPFL